MRVRDDDVGVHRGLMIQVAQIQLAHGFFQKTLAVSSRVSAAVVTAEMLQIERGASNFRCRCLWHICVPPVDVGAHSEPLSSTPPSTDRQSTPLHSRQVAITYAV